MRRGAILIWILVSLGGWILTDIWPRQELSPFSNYIGPIKSIERKGFVSQICIGSGMITAYHFPDDLKPGDVIEVYGHFNDVLSLKNQGYGRYLKAQSIHWSGRAEGWSDTQKNHFFYRWKDEIKSKLDEAVDFLYRGDGFLVKALLYGDKTELDERIKNDFARTGTAHVLALSGFHTGILALILHRRLSFCSIKLRTTLIGIFLLGYCFFTGMKPSILRATAFFLFLYGSFLAARAYDLLSISAITASLFTVINPFVLYDIGFQLSFLSVVSIGMFLPILEEGIKRFGNLTGLLSLNSEKKTLLIEQKLSEKIAICRGNHKDISKMEENPWEVLGTYKGKNQGTLLVKKDSEIKSEFISMVLLTISAQILTTPVVIYHFHQISLVSVLANLIVLPGITLLMTGFIISLVLLPIPFLSPILAKGLRMVMKELLELVRVLGSQRWSALDTGEISWGMAIFILIILVIFWKVWENKMVYIHRL